MTKTKPRESRVVILSPKGATYAPSLRERLTVCRSEKDIAKIYEGSTSDNITWVDFAPKLTDSLIVAATMDRARSPKRGPRRGQAYLAVKSPRPTSVPALHGLFEVFVGATAGYNWLPADELVPALLATDELRPELFVAVATDPGTHTVTLRRADLTAVVVPFNLFRLSGDGTRPDFSRPRVTDYGRTVAFGDYEAAGDAILY